MTRSNRFAFTPARRHQAKARIALTGPPGAGKTYTALALGTALADRVALIDTEHGSAAKYAAGQDGDGFTFDTLALDHFSPKALSAALAAAADSQYPVVIIDSFSHFWAGPGGMLEQVDLAARRYGGNTFAGWRDARPMERQMIEAILAYPGHVVVTMRSKTEYVVGEDERGRKAPRKVGMKPEQRDGIEYEFDVVGDLDVDHTLMVVKSRCASLADAVISKPGADLAQSIVQWLSGGVEAPDATEYVDRATAEGLTVEQARLLYREISGLNLLHAPMIHPQSGTPTTLGAYVRERGMQLGSSA